MHRPVLFCSPEPVQHYVLISVVLGADEGDVRLANSVIAADGSAEYGRLEVFHSGGWGTVCDNFFINQFRRNIGFDPLAADVACRQLGFQQGVQIQRLVRCYPAHYQYGKTAYCVHHRAFCVAFGSTTSEA